jgi:mono/diheme cytochrome c family protein
VIDWLVVPCRRLAAIIFRASWLGVVVFLAGGCDLSLPGKPKPEDRPIPAENVLTFEFLFNRHCAGCHGRDGKQGPAPPLNDPLFRAIVPEEELDMVISHGRPGTPMPPFERGKGGPLSAAQIQVLVNEIKGISYRLVEKRGEGPVKVDVVADPEGTVPRWGVVPAVPASAVPYPLPEGVGNAEQGAKVFARACANCHGENGTGIRRDEKRRNRINEPAFLALISDQAIRRIIITGRADLGMPSHSQKTGRPDDFQPLTAGDVAALTALLAGWRQGKPAR